MSYEEIEENENRFVALFTDHFDLGCAKLYANRVMNRDPFFNRVTEIRCEDLDQMIERAEDIFNSINVKPFIHSSNDTLSRKLREHNYELYAKISVLLLEGYYHLKGVSSISIERAELKLWIDTYAKISNNIYYKEIYNRLLNTNLDLYLAKIDHKSIGCMALFPTESLMGIYFLGVLERYKRLGALSSLLRHAYETAKDNNLMLFLSTYLDDDIKYYIKHGFTQLFIKEVYTRSF